jgi:hypothetical protein
VRRGRDQERRNFDFGFSSVSKCLTISVLPETLLFLLATLLSYLLTSLRGVLKDWAFMEL